MAMQTYYVDAIPAEVRVLMAQMLRDASSQEGCLIIEEDTWEQFVNCELETARIQDGLDQPDMDQVLADLAYEGESEFNEALYQHYLEESCRTCGGPCEPGACQVLTGY
jgi:hypothetical protein